MKKVMQLQDFISNDRTFSFSFNRATNSFSFRSRNGCEITASFPLENTSKNREDVMREMEKLLIEVANEKI